jgi:hypothetical protein
MKRDNSPTPARVVPDLQTHIVVALDTAHEAGAASAHRLLIDEDDFMVRMSQLTSSSVSMPRCLSRLKSTCEAIGARNRRTTSSDELHPLETATCPSGANGPSPPGYSDIILTEWLPASAIYYHCSPRLLRERSCIRRSFDSRNWSDYWLAVPLMILVASISGVALPPLKTGSLPSQRWSCW